MTVSQLIAELKKLSPDAEIGILAASACARPPIVVRVEPYAGWLNRNQKGHVNHRGFNRPEHAYLLRPKNEVI